MPNPHIFSFQNLGTVDNSVSEEDTICVPLSELERLEEIEARYKTLTSSIKGQRQTWEGLYISTLQEALDRVLDPSTPIDPDDIPKIRRLSQVRGFQAILAALDGEDVNLERLEPPFYIPKEEDEEDSDSDEAAQEETTPGDDAQEKDDSEESNQPEEDKLS